MKSFDIKLRGRLGEGESDLKTITVLNRILSVTPGGLAYEADPRHVELLSRSLGLQNSRVISTPGVKYKEDVDPELFLDEDDTAPPDSSDTVNAIHEKHRYKRVNRHGIAEYIKQEIRFDDNPDIMHIVPYSETYGKQKQSFMCAIRTDHQ